jgi:hypothetical protein
VRTECAHVERSKGEQQGKVLDGRWSVLHSSVCPRPRPHTRRTDRQADRHNAGLTSVEHVALLEQEALLVALVSAAQVPMVNGYTVRHVAAVSREAAKARRGQRVARTHTLVDLVVGVCKQ